MVYNITQVSLRQAITPQRIQGRMNATMRFLVWGTIPLGAFTGGILGSTIGLHTTLWVAAGGELIALIPPMFSPVPRIASIEAAVQEYAPEVPAPTPYEHIEEAAPVEG